MHSFCDCGQFSLQFKISGLQGPLSECNLSRLWFSLADDDKYDELVKKLKELNALNKEKKPSFHVDRPRRSAVKFQETLASNQRQERCTKKTVPPAKSTVTTKNDKNTVSL